MSTLTGSSIKYHLTNDRLASTPLSDFQKIIDYLLTYVGEIEVIKSGDGNATIHYVGTPLMATLKLNYDPGKTDSVISNQITLTCEINDNVSVNLIKNATKNTGYRIFDPQTQSYLVNDPSLLSLTSLGIEPSLGKIFESYNLNPLFQLNNSLVFFAQDKKGKIHLVNRHLLEYKKYLSSSLPKKTKEEFSLIVAEDIGRFVALFDRGLIPITFYKAMDEGGKLINLSGMNANVLTRDVIAEPIYFNLDLPQQTFVQGDSPQGIKIKKGQSLVKALKLKNYLAVKVGPDVRFENNGEKLIPILSVSIFLDNS